MLDRETGLVWERTPINSSTPPQWGQARVDCAQRTVGGRKGWRLPSVHELQSLLDPFDGAPPAIPDGHPFSFIPAVVWSATTSALASTDAWVVFPLNAHVTTNAKTASTLVWCVRGGQNHGDVY